MVSKQQMRRHIADLTASQEIRVWFIKKTGEAYGVRKVVGAAAEIRIVPVRSVVTYAAALHEIGYVIGRHHSRRRMVREHWAWQWARENALVWSPRMERLALDCLARAAAGRPGGRGRRRTTKRRRARAATPLSKGTIASTADPDRR